MTIAKLEKDKIPSLVEKFKNDIISIPIFQREFVWSDYQIVTLAESIYKGYPIGIMIFYESIESGKTQYKVLDGQQRLLSMVLMREERVRTQDDERKRIIWFNVKTEEFKITESERRPGAEWIRLSEVITKNNTKEIVPLAQRLASEARIPLEEVLEKLTHLWNMFNVEYEVPIYILQSNTDIDTLGEIFVRINFAGTRVRSADVNYTMLAIANEKIAKLMREFYHELANATFQDFKGYEWDLEYGVIVRTFLAFLSEGKARLENTVLEQARALKELLKEKENKLEEIWELTKSSIIETIKLLMDDNLLAIKGTKSRFLISQTPLVTMAYYIGRKFLINNIPIPENEKQGLIGWFILATYHRRYTSATETKLNEDLQTIAGGGNYRNLVENLRKSVGELKVSEETYRGSGSDKIFLLYTVLRFNKARDFYDKETLISSLNATIHHIFPINIIGGRYGRNMVNDIANMTLLLSKSNESIRESPRIYLKRIPPEILRAHLIPEDRTLWREEKFKDFLEERRKLLVNAINSLLSKLGVV
ncbi:MAG: DUF262 domain-containing protein [Crenarchaeota archaeon]|nr:DUF262 domain-containing protein [Thermoproteota archaeon]